MRWEDMSTFQEPPMPFELPALPYDKSAFGEILSAETLDYHWGKHHRAYVTKTNELLGELPDLGGASLAEVVRKARSSGNSKLFNNSAQLWNHSFFWQCLAPAEGQKPGGRLAPLIQDGFGDEEALLK